jgi:hypothetical protein
LGKGWTCGNKKEKIRKENPIKKFRKRRKEGDEKDSLHHSK